MKLRRPVLPVIKTYYEAIFRQSDTGSRIDKWTTGTEKSPETYPICHLSGKSDAKRSKGGLFNKRSCIKWIWISICKKKGEQSVPQTKKPSQFPIDQYMKDK